MIEQGLYNEILKNIPIICVDGIIMYNGKFLMLKRNNEPEKGKWWFPGGRLLKGEKLEYAIVRKVKEETGLDTTIEKMVGITQTKFETGPNEIPVHTINITYLLKLINFEINVDKNHQEYGWFNEMPEDCHEEIKKIMIKI